jgi:hypothetical protein
VRAPGWAVLGALAALGCGTPHAGDPCRSIGRYQCADVAAALECRAGTWAALPCRGDGGCAFSTTGEVSCDLAGARAGDLCPTAKENDGLCGPGGASVLQCRAGAWVTTSTCRTCGVVGGYVVCGP